MALQGPIVVITDDSNVELAAAIKAHDGTIVVECTWQHAPETIRTAQPAAVVIDAPAASAPVKKIAAFGAAIDAAHQPYLPVLTRVSQPTGPVIQGALPISAKTSPERIVAQISSAQRVRTLHATVLQRAAELTAKGRPVPSLPDSDPLTDAAALVTGRGRNYPELCPAVGERVALIGSLSVETAARHLTSRALDGIFIGPGFGPPTINAFLIAIGEDSRFRDLPVALIGGQPVTVDCSAIPNFEQFDAPAADVVEWM